MPYLNGFEMCTQVKSDERICHIPFILLTANAGEIPTIIGFETGADDYITKPFSLKLLEARLINLLESRRKLREIFSHQLPVLPKNSGLSKLDESFLEKIHTVVKNNISNVNLDADLIVKELLMSRTNLYRKLKALTNQSVHEFIRMVRLKQAAELLRQGESNISEIAVKVGFNDRSYFTYSFKKMFGLTPSDYIK
jgi:AraC-like DNA-binding protein